MCDLHKVLAGKPRVFAVCALHGQAALLDEGRMRCRFQRGVDARLHEFPQGGCHCEPGEEHSTGGNHHHDDDERRVQRQPREAALSCTCVLFAFPFLPTFFAIASWARWLSSRRNDRHAFLLRGGVDVGGGLDVLAGNILRGAGGGDFLDVGRSVVGDVGVAGGAVVGRRCCRKCP